jgi:hypothetical protein
MERMKKGRLFAGTISNEENAGQKQHPFWAIGLIRRDD